MTCRKVPFSSPRVSATEEFSPLSSQLRGPQCPSQLPRRFEGYAVDFPELRSRRPDTPDGPQVELRDHVIGDLDRNDINAIQTSLRFAIEKFRTYVNLMEASPGRWAALVLLPGCTARCIQQLFVNKRGKAELIIGALKKF
ncbi:uncharacterized protein B0T15DRAFT_522414 [Chaetomium strumarium]|uniref:Uncharacterized protein n=1 Tax=Chaetomium strumarium TaxID=1170767 RepID=A0AAJ0GX47_9PEZI|nr:hypothetical protein B0T15DRAFT_522414 [Chaetomium strumarium]